MQWDLSAIPRSWGEDARELLAYRCPSCNAQFITGETTAATACPYCGSGLIPQQFEETMKPDYILPFCLNKEEAKQALKSYFWKKFLLARTFSSAWHLEDLKGIYVPFWLFEADAEADCSFLGTSTYTHYYQSFSSTITRYYRAHRAGSMRLEYIGVDVSPNMEDNHLDSIEPYNFQRMKPFSADDLSGYLAEKCDINARHSIACANNRCQATVVEAMQQDVQGYETVSAEKSSVRLMGGKVHYALMPVWCLHTKWKRKDYLYLVNGQTGKIAGELPVSKAKYWAAFAAIALFFGGLVHVSGVGLWIASLFM